MSTCQVRRFTRADRDQVTALANAHIGAVVPGVAVSVSGLMSQLEREPGEFIVDPWVIERVTLVAEQRQRVVAAAHLLRYAAEPQVSESYRDAGEIRWLVFWPEAPYWPDVAPAAEALAEACLAQLQRWAVTRRYADGALPAPGVYGVPEQWPHIRQLYQRAGFRPRPAGAGGVETVFLARVSDLVRGSARPGNSALPEDSAIAGLVPRRTLGINGTRISAVLDQEVVGFIEVGNLDESPRTIGTRGWADIGNLEISPPHPDAGLKNWLLGQAADWLDLGGFTRLLGYADGSNGDEEKFFTTAGFQLLTRTVRGFELSR